MRRIRRTRRNCMIGLTLTAPLWAPLLALELFARGVAIAAERAARFVSDVAMAFYESDAQVRERNKQARTAWLRERAGQWLRYGCWVCACPHTNGRGLDDCSTCHTARPSLETMPPRIPPASPISPPTSTSSRPS